ncbi:MAG: dihydrolipoamide acetyltransferase family protein [Gammaproteobacteria bacterium]|jgi:2-oxoglutarate dehydrogenase E2 component (dihydrolipoamide succinyltransferase)
MDVLMPQLGETVAEGTVSNWHKNVGDSVAKNEILLDVETDKVSMEIPAPKAGVLSEIRVQAGETVDVGTVLAIILAEGESAAPGADPPAAPAEAAPAGGGPVDSAGSPDEAQPAEPAEQPAATSAAAPRQTNIKLSPAVRRLVAEHQLDVSSIEGTGRDGRVTRRDVVEYIDSGMAHARSEIDPAAHPVGDTVITTGVAAAEPAEPQAADPGAQRIPFNRIRRLTADHMVKSKATSPHVLQAVEVNFGNVDRVRLAVRESFKADNGFSLTYLPFIAHAVCRALAEFPHVNASVESDALVLHESVNMAIAIDLGPEGLVAPVIKSAEQMTVTELAHAIQDLAKRARSNRLKPDDLSGGTYTLSNSGTFGTLITAPIINQPQVAILSTDGVRKKPVVIESAEGDSIGIRPVGILAQSFDHRAFDGAYSAAFLDRVRRLLEGDNWFREL